MAASTYFESLKTRLEYWLDVETWVGLYDQCSQKVQLVSTWAIAIIEDVKSFDYSRINLDISGTCSTIAEKVRTFSCEDFQKNSKEFLAKTIECIKSKPPISLIFGPSDKTEEMTAVDEAARLEKEYQWQELLKEQQFFKSLRLENPTLSLISERLNVEVKDKKGGQAESVASIFWEIKKPDGKVQAHCLNLSVIPEGMTNERWVDFNFHNFSGVEVRLEPVFGVRLQPNKQNIVQDTYAPIDCLKFSPVRHKKLRYNLEAGKPAFYKFHVLEQSQESVYTHIEIPAANREALVEFLREKKTILELFDFLEKLVGQPFNQCFEDFQIIKTKGSDDVD